jgi:hypothetical protein
MPARPTKTKSRAGKTPVTPPADRNAWVSPNGSLDDMQAFGLRMSGGGTHQSKTMMLAELRTLLSSSRLSPEALRQAVVVDNALAKSTSNTRKLTYRHLAALYGLNDQTPLTRLFFALWRTNPAAHPQLALLVALARDPLLRDTAPTVIDGSVGEALKRPVFEAALREKHAARFSLNTLRTLAQNCASTWTQSGHLLGPIKKVRRRITPAPQAVTLAALLATICGFGGPAILSSTWMRVLDLTPDQALDCLRKAEGLGLARVRIAGDITEISIRRQMATTLKVPELELAR